MGCFNFHSKGQKKGYTSEAIARRTLAKLKKTLESLKTNISDKKKISFVSSQ